MTVASEISRITGNIADTYTAASGKGATMPATENSDNLATCIASIPSGGSSHEKLIKANYWIDTSGDVHNLEEYGGDFGNLNATATSVTTQDFENKLQNNTDVQYVDLSSLESITGNDKFTYTFYNDTNLVKVDFSSLETATGDRIFSNAWNGCTSLTDIDFYSLTTASGENIFLYALTGTAIVNLVFPALTTISGTNAFNCIVGDFSSTNSTLETVSFPVLNSIDASFVFQNAFYQCSALTTVSFPALTSTSFGSYTNQFKNMLSLCSGVTVHFPSNLQSVIGSWTDVTGGFAGTNTTVLFDLPATS